MSLYRRKGQKGLTEYERRRMEQYVIPTSGKMVLIDKLLPKLLKEKHKVCFILCYFNDILNLLLILGSVGTDILTDGEDD